MKETKYSMIYGVAAFIIFTLTLIMMFLMNWKPVFPNTNQASQQYAYMMFIEDEYGNRIKSKLNKIEFTEGSVKYTISMCGSHYQENSLCILSTSALSTNDSEKENLKDNKVIQEVSSCIGSCSFANNKYRANYDPIDINDFNPKTILFVMLLSLLFLGGYLWSCNRHYFYNSSEKFNLMMYTAVAILCFMRVYFSLTLVSLNFNTVHYIFQSILLALILPLVVVLFNIRIETIQKIKSKFKFLVLYSLLIITVILDFFLWNSLLFPKAYYAPFSYMFVQEYKDLFLNFSLFNHVKNLDVLSFKTSLIEFGLIFILYILVFYRLYFTSKNKVSLPNKQVSKKEKFFWINNAHTIGVLAVSAITILVFLFYFMADSERKSLPLEIAFSLILPMLLTGILLCKKQGMKLTQKIISLAITGGVFAILATAMGDGGTIIYFIFIALAFAITLLSALNQPQIKNIVFHFKHYTINLHILCHVVIISIVVLSIYPLYLKYNVNSQVLAHIEKNQGKFNPRDAYFDVSYSPICSIKATGSDGVLVAEDINKADECFKNPKNRKNNNKNIRTYGWLIGQPLNYIMPTKDFGRLQDIERLKAYHIPKNSIFGDGYMISKAHFPRIDGYDYEHIVGAVLIKPLGVIGALSLLLAWFLLFKSIPRIQIASRCYIATLGGVTLYICLQSTSILPFVGNNAPLMIVSSFSKDAFPMIVGLVTYLCLGSSIVLTTSDLDDVEQSQGEKQ